MKKEVKILILLVLGIFILNYNIIDAWLIETFEDFDEAYVERVIDGDTIVVQSTTISGNGKRETDSGGQEVKIRMLGINSPEKGEVGYLEAKEFLEERILGERVRIYYDGAKTDRYGRTLGYVFLGNENINLESVREGFSNFYFPAGKQRFYGEFVESWNSCINENLEICKRAKEKCIRIENIDIKKQEIVLVNECGVDVDLSGWSVKDEGRKKFVFEKEVFLAGDIRILSAADFGEDYVWTKSGDSAFLRDGNNLLVDFYHY